MTLEDAALKWRPIHTADYNLHHIQNPIIGIDHSWPGRNRVSKCGWQPEFSAWISSCRMIEMAEGYMINGQTYKLHSPEIETPTHWIPMPEFEDK